MRKAAQPCWSQKQENTRTGNRQMQTADGGLAARVGDPAARAGAGARRGSNTAELQVSITIECVTLEPRRGLSKSPLTEGRTIPTFLRRAVGVLCCKGYSNAGTRSQADFNYWRETRSFCNQIGILKGKEDILFIFVFLPSSFPFFLPSFLLWIGTQISFE